MELDLYKTDKLIKVNKNVVDIGRNYTPMANVRFDNLYHINMDLKAKHFMKF